MNPERYEKVGQLFYAALELGASEPGGISQPRLRRRRRPAAGGRVAARGPPAGGRFRRRSGDQRGRELACATGGRRDRQGKHRRLPGALPRRQRRNGRSGPGARPVGWAAEVAVKVLRTALTSNPDAVRRFEQEEPPRGVVAQPSEHRHENVRDWRPAPERRLPRHGVCRRTVGWPRSTGRPVPLMC